MLDTEDSDGFGELGGPTLVDLLERQEEINRALLDIQRALERRTRTNTWLIVLTAIGLAILSRS